MAISCNVITPDEQYEAELSGLLTQLDSVRSRLETPDLPRIEKSALRLHERVLSEQINEAIMRTRKSTA